MRQETNNEIDLLLRRLSRRQDIDPPAAGLRIDGDHLDADELSSYAENVLPEAARSRYTEHLAECASCRKLVAQLSASVGLVGAQAISTASEPSAIRKFLASLFSPLVLRYAVPALGLLLVAVIALVALRQDQGAGPMARLNESDSAASPAAPTPETQELAGSLDSSDNLKSPAPESRDGRARETQPRSAGDTAEPAIETQGAKEAGAAKGELQPVEPRPAAKAAPAVTVAEDTRKRVDAETKKQAEAGPPVAPGSEGARAYDSAKTVDRQPAAPARSTPARARPLELGRSGGAAIQSQRAEEKDRDEAETRSVAGRRFRKSGNTWIDTAYDPSQATVNLSRGSEQYRALVADEPGIRTIAEQLEGEIIVVWKGRAYKIR